MTLGEKGRIGVLLPANNAVLEPELWPALPPGVALHPTRLLVEGDLTAEAVRAMEAQVDRGVRELLATSVDMIIYADMVTTFIMEDGWNAATAARISAESDRPCLSTWQAMMDATRALGLRRIALGSPYPRPIHDQAVAYFRKQGFEITAEDTLDILGVKDVSAVTRDQVIGLAERLEPRRAEGLLLLATDLPTFDVLETLEARAGRPVLTCNQALLWRSLRMLGQDARLPRLGQLLRDR